MSHSLNAFGHQKFITRAVNCDLVCSCRDTWTPQGGFHSLLAHSLCGGSVVSVFSAHSLACHVVLHSSCSCSRVLTNSEIHPQLLTLQHLLSDWEDRQCVKAVQPGRSFPGFPASCSKDRKSLNSPSISALLLTSFESCETFVLSLQPPPSLLYSWKRVGSQ